ncbi:ZIP family metal transporter [Hazenella sp. IB182357]|uniref:ZIP family metal transporter n=1 Tax=Polycladospora coralii TaxID=2771432 RepID=A0A926RSY8_9BACL|nr:ZIP family metal transporter [Polycladospora coralii]MBD1372120.1 ZIP family metal transporter [Polycladospora coralii]
MVAVIYSAIAGLATVLGAILTLSFRLTDRIVAFALGMSVGVMVFISYLDLIPTAMMKGGWAHLVVGMVLAILFMLLLHHIPFSKVGSGDQISDYTRLGVLLVIAVAVHNTPEGAAIGIGFDLENHLGHTLALAMFIHNIPEGIGLAAPLRAAGFMRSRIILLSLICGATLPLGTWIGIRFLSQSSDIISGGLIFAAVVMLWTAICEISPSAFRQSPLYAYFGIGMGSLFMCTVHMLH